MTTVRQMLKEKGNGVVTVAPGTSLLDTIKLLAEKRIGAVLVVENEKVVGIFSERDFVQEIAQDTSLDMNTKIDRYMTKAVFYVTEDQTVDDCMATMTEKHIRHLPVLANDQLAGVISIGDVVKEFISQKEITIRSLENYILGRDYNQ
jgi:CBS domain-containing protein